MLVSESVFEMCRCAVYVQDGSNQLLGGHLQETQDRFQAPFCDWTHSTPAMGDVPNPLVSYKEHKLVYL